MKRESHGSLLSTVFVDYDNIYLSLKRKSEEAAKRFAKNAHVWLGALATGQLITPTNGPGLDLPRRIVMNRCYGNSFPRRNASDDSTDMNSFPFVRHHFVRAGFEVIDCPPLTKQLKNSADIRMVMDVRDYLLHDTYFDEFVILSGDADFTPVLHRLRQHARRTVVYANDYTVAPYRAISDGEVREADLIKLLMEGVAPQQVETATAGQPKGLPSPDALASARKDILSEVLSTVKQAQAPVPLEALADRAVRVLGHDKTVGLAWGGAGSFRDLLVNGLPAEVRLSDAAPYFVYDTARQAAPEPLRAETQEKERHLPSAEEVRQAQAALGAEVGEASQAASGNGVSGTNGSGQPVDDMSRQAEPQTRQPAQQPAAASAYAPGPGQLAAPMGQGTAPAPSQLEARPQTQPASHHQDPAQNDAMRQDPLSAPAFDRAAVSASGGVGVASQTHAAHADHAADATRGGLRQVSGQFEPRLPQPGGQPPAPVQSRGLGHDAPMASAPAAQPGQAPLAMHTEHHQQSGSTATRESVEPVTRAANGPVTSPDEQRQPSAQPAQPQNAHRNEAPVSTPAPSQPEREPQATSLPVAAGQPRGERPQRPETGSGRQDSSTSALQAAIARIHEACQAPPLSPPEYRVLFQVMAEEINANGLTGSATLVNIAQRAQDHGVEVRRDDVRFVLEVVSEADPWFEQGASAPLFAGRFRNFVVARCRSQGLQLSADELDLIEAWFSAGAQRSGGVAARRAQQAGAAAAPQAQGQGQGQGQAAQAANAQPLAGHPQTAHGNASHPHGAPAHSAARPSAGSGQQPAPSVAGAPQQGGWFAQSAAEQDRSPISGPHSGPSSATGLDRHGDNDFPRILQNRARG